MFKKSISSLAFIVALQLASPHVMGAGTGLVLNPDDISIAAPVRGILPSTPALDALTAFPGHVPADSDRIKAEAAIVPKKKTIMSQVSCCGWNCATVAEDVSWFISRTTEVLMVIDSTAVKPAIKLVQAEIDPAHPNESLNSVLKLLTLIDTLIAGEKTVASKANQYIAAASDITMTDLGSIAGAYLSKLEIPGVPADVSAKIKNGIIALVQVMCENNDLQGQYLNVTTISKMIIGFMKTPTGLLSYNDDTNTLSYNSNNPAKLGGSSLSVVIPKDTFTFEINNGTSSRIVTWSIDDIANQLVTLLNAFHTQSASSAMRGGATAATTAAIAGLMQVREFTSAPDAAGTGLGSTGTTASAPDVATPVPGAGAGSTAS